jgi:hypothetical protein
MVNIGVDYGIEIIAFISCILTFIYLYKAANKFSGSLKRAYRFIAIGTFFILINLLILTAYDFGLLNVSNPSTNSLMDLFTGLAALSIAIGSIKINHIVSFLPESFVKKITEYIK